MTLNVVAPAQLNSSDAQVEMKQKLLQEENQEETVFAAEEQNEINTDTVKIDSVKQNDIQTQTGIVAKETSNEKVTVDEGLKLVGKGFINKLKDIGKSIIKHPIKTIVVAAGTTAAIAALPLIGISSATGAAILGLGFAGFAVAKTTKDTVEAVKDAKGGRNDELREDLEKIGGDGVDLAMSLPFVPKAMKQMSRTLKYGPKVALNTEAIANFTDANGMSAKLTELAKADLKINYETIGNEMGLKVKPNLVFDKTMPELKNGTICTAGEYDFITGNLKINENLLTPMGKLKAKLMCGKSAPSGETLLRHELEHFKQISEVAQAQGVNGVENAAVSYCDEIINATGGKKKTMQDLYQEVNTEIDKYAGMHKEAKIKAQNNDFDGASIINDRMDRQMNYIETLNSSSDYIKSELRYQDAAISNLGVSPETVRNMTTGDKSVFNREFYQKVIDANGTIASGTERSAKAQSYVQAIVEKVKPNEQLVQEFSKKAEGLSSFIPADKQKLAKLQLELYKANLLEKEAFAAQDLYTSSVLKGRPGMLSSNVQTQMLTSDDKISDAIEDVVRKPAIKNGYSLGRFITAFDYQED